MLKRFQVNITKNTLFNKSDKLLLAFSGGIDSVVLADLLQRAGYSFELAHCNFQLRGAEANGDTDFCNRYADSIGVRCHVAYFDTKTYATEHKLSIQMAARELRYQWFKELIASLGFSTVLTAHHANDAIETLFVNLVRGTGIKGLEGIPEKQNHLVRPLLFATKDDILNYASLNGISYREDSSNAEVKYKRNFIRHQIVPELKKLNPAIEQTLQNSMRFFKQSSEIVSAFAAVKFKELCEVRQDQLYIAIKPLLNEPQKETLLFEWLHDKNFKTSQIHQLSEALLTDEFTGKQFSSATHKLVIDRAYIIVKAFSKEPSVNSFSIQNLSDTVHLPISMHFEETTDHSFSRQKNEISIPYSDTLFPLTLRKWKTGDKFRPFGMNGFKKLSDFFKDQKLTLFEKESTWILECKEHIIWVVGQRMDDRCRISESTETVLKIVVNSVETTSLENGNL